jgi:hypothetical protein
MFSLSFTFPFSPAFAVYFFQFTVPTNHAPSSAWLSDLLSAVIIRVPETRDFGF